MRRIVDLRIALVGLAAWLAVACTGNPVPTSAQAGSTIVLPFATGEVPGLGQLAEIGFGGSDFADPQRGGLVVRLDTPVPFELVTRLALLAAAPVEAAIGPSGGALGRNLLLVVDIPANAPPGTHGVHLFRRRIEGGVPVDTPLGPAHAPLKILPNVVNAGGTPITGTPTPSQFWSTTNGWVDMIVDLNADGIEDSMFENAIPAPSFGVGVTTASGAPPADAGSRFVAFASVEVNYPPGVIDVLRVVASEPAETLVWTSDDGNGVLTISGLTKKRALGTGVGPFRVVFTLDDADAALLDLSMVTVTLVDARDQHGDDSIGSDWQLAASASSIR